MDMPPLFQSTPISAFFQEASKRKMSLQSQTRKTFGRWTKEEHQNFIEGLKLYGKNWKKVEEHVGTRNGAQIRSHAQKFFNRLEKELRKKKNLLKDDSMSDLDGSENMEGIEDYMEHMKEKEMKGIEEEKRSRSQSTNFSNVSNNGNAAFLEYNSCVNKLVVQKEKIIKEESPKKIEEKIPEKNSIEIKKEMLLKELGLLFSEETIKRIQTIISLLNETSSQNEGKEENHKISFFNSLFNNFNDIKNSQQKLPKLSDLVDMNDDTKNTKMGENGICNSQELSEKRLRKDSFKFCNNEDGFNSNLAFFSLKRKGSLDDTMLQKKVKRENS